MLGPRNHMDIKKNKIRAIRRKILLRNEPSRQEKIAFYIGAFLVALFTIPLYIFLLKILPISIPDIFPILAFSIILLTFLLIIFYFYFPTPPSSNRSNRELARLEENLESTAKEVIISNLGKTLYLELNANFASINVNQTDICEKLLKLEEVSNDTELKFHIYFKLFKFFFIDESYQKSISSLNSAIEINPNNIISRISLAETYEYIGNGEKAIDAYKKLFEINHISNSLKNYINAQIERVVQKGPRKGPPMTGFRYMTY